MWTLGTITLEDQTAGQSYCMAWDVMLREKRETEAAYCDRAADMIPRSPAWSSCFPLNYKSDVQIEVKMEKLTLEELVVPRKGGKADRKPTSMGLSRLA